LGNREPFLITNYGEGRSLMGVRCARVMDFSFCFRFCFRFFFNLGPRSRSGVLSGEKEIFCLATFSIKNKICCQSWQQLAMKMENVVKQDFLDCAPLSVLLRHPLAVFRII
jgi:hypothetical protein